MAWFVILKLKLNVIPGFSKCWAQSITASSQLAFSLIYPHHRKEEEHVQALADCWLINSSGSRLHLTL